MDLKEILTIKNNPFNEEILTYLNGEAVVYDGAEGYILFLLYLRYYNKFSLVMDVDFKVPIPPFFLNKKLLAEDLHIKMLQERREKNAILYDKAIKWSSWESEVIHLELLETNFEEDSKTIAAQDKKWQESSVFRITESFDSELRKMVLEMKEFFVECLEIPYGTVTFLWNKKLASYLLFKEDNAEFVKHCFAQGDDGIQKALSVLNDPLRHGTSKICVLPDKYVIAFREGGDEYDGTDIGDLNLNFAVNVYILEQLLEHVETVLLKEKEMDDK